MVGNGHRLRNSSMGDTINTYDVVIRYSPGPGPPLPPQCHPQLGLTPVMSQRLNNAPVHGYEQDVGSKTTMRLFYPESAHFDPRTENNPDTLLVLVPFKPMDFQWMEAILNDKKRVSVVGNRVQPLPGCSTFQLSCHPTLGDIWPLAGSERVLETAPVDLGRQPGASAHPQPLLHGSNCC